jgi:UTP--glucose-1-phosphate uridylyltransferase
MTKLRKAVFSVTGFGKQFLPATKAMPKELLPIMNKPLIQYAAEEAIAAGIVLDLCDRLQQARHRGPT